MLKHKRILLIFFFLVVTILISLPLLNVKKQPLPMKNALLYTLGNKNSYVLDVTTGKISLVASGLAAIAWSPSGEKILFRNVFAEDGADGLWVSDYDGSNLQQVFSMAKYPEMEIFRALWLTDNVILIDLIDSYNSTFYKLQISTMTLVKINQNVGPDFVSPGGDFWIQSRIEEGQRIVEIASFTGVHDSTTEINYSFYQGKPTSTYSPDGRKLVYPADTSLAGNTGDLWICNVDKDGFSNMHFFVNVGTYAVDYQWSPDGKTLGILNGSVFTLLDGETGKAIKEFQVKSKMTRFWWSPDSKSILTDDITDIWELNLTTGDTKSILNHEKVDSDIPILVVDWRLVPAP